MNPAPGASEVVPTPAPAPVGDNDHGDDIDSVAAMSVGESVEGNDTGVSEAIIA